MVLCSIFCGDERYAGKAATTAAAGILINGVQGLFKFNHCADEAFTSGALSVIRFLY